MRGGVGSAFGSHTQIMAVGGGALSRLCGENPGRVTIVRGYLQWGRAVATVRDRREQKGRSHADRSRSPMLAGADGQPVLRTLPSCSRFSPVDEMAETSRVGREQDSRRRRGVRWAKYLSDNLAEPLCALFAKTRFAGHGPAGCYAEDVGSSVVTSSLRGDLPVAGRSAYPGSVRPASQDCAARARWRDSAPGTETRRLFPQAGPIAGRRRARSVRAKWMQR